MIDSQGTQADDEPVTAGTRKHTAGQNVKGTPIGIDISRFAPDSFRFNDEDAKAYLDGVGDEYDASDAPIPCKVPDSIHNHPSYLQRLGIARGPFRTPWSPFSSEEASKNYSRCTK